ncbi:hypothetical protein Mcup_1448 [Metallosphaera cuprina Ar-4]|uniref:Uncharacterized protein n=1 Tax=Metallosphaera cuprina (strain Ar-4) TaxID=1006006 RepID=F4FYY1_METCR|nr:hypothetical protein Mcup_1448 [Metallosphaera cuprina Ar-4]
MIFKIKTKEISSSPHLELQVLTVNALSQGLMHIQAHSIF